VLVQRAKFPRVFHQEMNAMYSVATRTKSRAKLALFALVLCTAAVVRVDAQDTAITTTTVETERESRGFPWGILGLLGLLGLLGGRKKEEVHTHRETVRPVETHRATTTTTAPVTDRTVIRPAETGGISGTGGTMGGGTGGTMGGGTGGTTGGTGGQGGTPGGGTRL
jgi:hypothetical protein